MTQLFTLSITDNVNTVDFISDTTYFVADGQFDIGTPEVLRDYVAVRPGFYVPIINNVQTRKAVLKFEVRAATRTLAIAAINKIEKILQQISAQVRLSGGRRGQLSYAWEGATNMTYFEVYGGHLYLDGGILSVEKMYITQGGDVVVPDVTLELTLSGSGYGLSIYSDVSYEIPLYNPNVGAKQTGGVQISNQVAGYHYVQIDGTDLPGSGPVVTKLQMAANTTGYSTWAGIYVGLQKPPYPTYMRYPPTPLAALVSVGKTDFTGYSTFSWGAALYGVLGNIFWDLNVGDIGTFYAFLDLNAGFPTNAQVSLGFAGYTINGWRLYDEYVGVSSSGVYNLPLGTIVLPPGGEDLSSYGTPDPPNLTLWLASDAASSFELRALQLLPASSGLRVYTRRAASIVQGTLNDDAWKGLLFYKNTTNEVYNPFFALMDPLYLDPGENQRLYFHSFGDAVNDGRTFNVRLWGVPTYSSLAL